MKNLLIFLFPAFMMAQGNIVETSNGNTQTNNRGGYGVANVLLLPLGNHDPIYEFTRYKSRIQYNLASDYIEFNNGTVWKKLLDISYVPSWTEITDKPVLFSGSYNDLTNKPIIKQQFTYSGTTNASGIYTVVYAIPFDSIPNVQFNIIGGDVRDTARLTASSATGFTVTVQRRVDVVGLLPTYNNVSSASVGVLVTEN